MRMIFKVMVFLLASCCCGQEETPPPALGFFRLVNAMAAGEGPAWFFLDGGNLRERGYVLGNSTGSMGIPAGKHALEIRRAGVREGRLAADFAAGESFAAIAYAEKIPPRNPDEPPQFQGKFHTLRGRRGKGYGLVIVSVRAEETSVRLGVRGASQRRELVLERLHEMEIPLGIKPLELEISVEEGKRRLATIAMEERGSYVAVIYEDAAGAPQALWFREPKMRPLEKPLGGAEEKSAKTQ